MNIQRTFTLASVCGLLCAAVPMALTTPAAAQEQYEYESGEGVHEEEWYDPSDWFDDWGEDHSSIDYEEDDWWDYDYDADLYDADYYDEERAYSNEQYGDGHVSEYHYDAYYDGYNDGYEDDEFGYDYWDAAWDNDYASAYTDGYYDGYYDQQQGYDSEPYFYVTTRKLDEQRDTQDQRAQDKQRQRGDRANQKQRDQFRQRDQQQQLRTDMVRKRGTIKSIKKVDTDRAQQDHMVLRMTFENGNTIMANFGPKATRDRLPMQKGDRVTLRGDHVKRDGKSVLIVQKVTAGDESYTLRPSTAAQHDEWYTQADRQRDRSGRSQSRQADRHRMQQRGDQVRAQQQQQNRTHRVTMAGKVERITRTSSEQDGHTMLRIRFVDGTTRTIAFDQGISVSDLKISKGDLVWIRGQRKQINGQTVVSVQQIDVNGEPRQLAAR